jgi:PAS domain-containing protein
LRAIKPSWLVPRSSATRLAAIVESSTIAIISKDLQRHLSRGRYAERMFGYTAASDRSIDSHADPQDFRARGRGAARFAAGEKIESRTERQRKEARAPPISRDGAHRFAIGGARSRRIEECAGHHRANATAAAATDMREH